MLSDYLKAQRTLIVGTTGGEYTVRCWMELTQQLLQAMLNIKKQSSYGSANVDALTSGNAVSFYKEQKEKLEN